MPEVAIEYARMSDAIVVLGSATPSVDSYYKAKTGVYRLWSWISVWTTDLFKV